MTDFETLYTKLHTLAVFYSLRRDPVLAAFASMLAAGDADAFAESCSAFEAKLFEYGDNWSEYLLHAALENENIAVRMHARGRSNDTIDASCERELEVLQETSLITLEDFSHACAGYFTPWKTSSIDFTAEYRRHLGEVSKKGYGMFAKAHVFRLVHEMLEPVLYPDPQRLCDLPGYEPERKKIIANVEALLQGKPAVNMLLYGDAGTGKSSTIKAIANEYKDRGLRLIEVKKKELYQIPLILEQLADLPLKFILFIDDLSFSGNDDNFAALKAVLEGSVSGKSENTIVAATSNRRHLVKELMSDRLGDDIHENDTRQELLSLSARFGLIVTFQKPDKDRYLYIVSALAEEYGVVADRDDLFTKAEMFALRAGGRTPRTARQFIEQYKSGVL